VCIFETLSFIRLRLHYFSYHIAFIVCFLFLAQKSDAQVFSNNKVGNSMQSDQKIISDTNNKKQTTIDDKVKIVCFTIHDTTKLKPDTSIHLLHRNQLIGLWDVDLGNTGSSVNSLLFTPDVTTSMQLGIRSLRPYLFKWDSLKFYNTTRPYTDVYYRLGSKQEQMIDLFHTQNILPRWNIAANYHKTGSPGFYKLQRTNHDHFSLNTHYQSINLRYDLKAALIYNKMQQDENRGIVDERFLNDANYNDKRLVPVNAFNAEGSTNRSSVTNYFRSISFNLQHQYFIGKADSVMNIDSTETIYTFKPIIGIKHRLYSTYSYYRYKDMLPDSLQYNVSILPNDSLYSKYFLNQLGNAFSLTGDIRLKDKILQSEAGYGIEIESPTNMTYHNRFANNYLFAQINKEAKMPNEWLYKASLKFYFSGNAIGNTSLNLQAGRNFSDRTGNVRAGLDFCINSPSYIQSNYESNYYITNTSLSKQSINKVYIHYINQYLKTHIDLNYFVVGNYIYFDTSSIKAQQYNKAISILQGKLNKEFTFKKFHLRNELVLQGIPNNPAIHLPWLAGRHILSYQNLILKKKLQIATGLETRYNTSYQTDVYNPLIFGFASQQRYKIGNIPQVNYFFNFKVKRFRSSISFDELQQFFVRNNLNYKGYAAQNFIIRFGFHWVFIN
jgi:hypothetical protein